MMRYVSAILTIIIERRNTTSVQETRTQLDVIDNLMLQSHTFMFFSKSTQIGIPHIVSDMLCVVVVVGTSNHLSSCTYTK